MNESAIAETPVQAVSPSMNKVINTGFRFKSMRLAHHENNYKINKRSSKTIPYPISVIMVIHNRRSEEAEVRPGSKAPQGT